MVSELEKFTLRKITYTAKEAAFILSISTCWLYELIRQGEFEVVSMGNVRCVFLLLQSKILLRVVE